MPNIMVSCWSIKCWSLVSMLVITHLLLACQTEVPKKELDAELITEGEAKATPTESQLPVDEKILKGQLENGIAYIIRENEKPENFAELRLVVKAGSLNEDDNQLGFAHFVEHMAFNGTEDFNEQEIVEFVESIGMRFGAHLNASTSFDRTIYKLRVPSDDPEILEKAIHILENWAHKVSFNAKDIDEERGVVLEEWRARKGVGERLAKQQWPIIFEGTNYFDRLPIGTQENITTGSHEDLIRFYDTWYHPDLMSIVAVGDFDQAQIETLINKYFNKIPARESAKELPTQYLEMFEAPVIKMLTDKELTRTNLSITWRNNTGLATHDLNDYKKGVVKNIAVSIISKRLSDLGLETESPFFGASLSHNRNVPTSQQLNLQSNIKPGRSAEAFEALLREIKRATEHGVSEQELATEKELYLQRFESALASENTFNHRVFLRSYVNHFISGSELTSLTQDYHLTKSFLDEIDISQVHEQIKKWAQTQNATVFVTAPEQELASLPNESELSDIWQRIGAENTQAIKDKLRVTALMDDLPEAGKIVEKTFNEHLQAHQWLLSNGARVVLKPTDFKENSIMFRSVSPGGFATVDDEAYLSSFGMMGTLDYLGLGELDMQALSQFSREKQFSLRTQVGRYTESMSGSSNLEDLELLMQSIHLRFIAPVKDQARFDWLKDTYRPRIEKKYNRPEAQFEAAIQAKTNAGDPRSVEFDVSMLERQNLDSIYQVYKERFANAGDFTFVFVGDLDLEVMELYATRYLASLPANESREQRKKLPNYALSGDVQVHMEKGEEPKARVIYSLLGEASWSFKQRQVMAALRSALQNTLRKRLREELGGVYSVSVNANLSRWPYQKYSLGVSFTCDPQRVEELVKEVQSVFDTYRKGDIDKSLLANYKTQAKTNRAKNLKENPFWMAYIMSFVSPRQPLDYKQYDALIDSLTYEDLQQAAKQYLKEDNRVYATLKPESQ